MTDTLRPYKFVVQAIVQRVGQDGQVTGEVIGQQLEVFGCEGLAEWASDFADRLKDEQAAAQTTEAAT
jgi:hypothetical protein